MRVANDGSWNPMLWDHSNAPSSFWLNAKALNVETSDQFLHLLAGFFIVKA